MSTNNYDTERLRNLKPMEIPFEFPPVADALKLAGIIEKFDKGELAPEALRDKIEELFKDTAKTTEVFNLITESGNE